MDRRDFLLTGAAAALGARLLPASAAPVTLTEWMHATAKEREDGVQVCLDLIRRIDPSVHAWVQVAPEPPTGTGELLGIPFGVKDIIETRGLSTEYGSAIYRGRVGEADAAIVAEMRRRGGLLLGKTQCTAFAYKTPPPTRNPMALDHTPGGSSSGSAAAVAAGMVPMALGTQTRGSVLRPASFCGVTGFKPSYGWFSMEGVLPLAATQDTLGLFTHSAADMLLLWGALGRGMGADETLTLGVPEPLQQVEPEMGAAFASALEVLRAGGLSITAVDMGEMLDRLATFNELIMFYEGARFHKQRFEQYGARLEDLGDLVQAGLKISDDRYEEAMRYIADCKTRVGALLSETPVILTPAAPGPAPLGLASTGNPVMNAPWTALGQPAISIPMPVGTSLPLGLQLTAAVGEETRVLRTAVMVQKLLGSSRR